MRKLLGRACVAVLAASAAVFSFATPASAADRGKGVVGDLTWGISRADMDRTISLMKTAGVNWVRANLNWSDLEPTTKGVLSTYWLGEIDYAIDKARAAGINVLAPIADGVPYWASADPTKHTDTSGKHWDKFYKPRSFADYASFAKRIVTRYKAKGVHAYEVWNEPNYVRFWPSGPNAADYVAMLKAAYPAIKAADPSATVVTGGLSRNDYPFVDAMYAAGAKPYFNALAVHPYTSADPLYCWNDPGTNKPSIDAFCGIESVRSVMVAKGDSAKSIWLTEFGWSTASGLTAGVSETLQAQRLTAAYRKMDTYAYVGKAFWYNFRNNWWQNNDPNDVEANYGLLRVDFSPKPSYTAFQNVSTLPAAPVTSAVLAAVTS
jgi:aryl-phospho-beta-D-glucosidase BglC (GH1 family)